MTIQTQFILDDNGEKIAVIVPIEEYNRLKGDESEIPEWQKKILDDRLSKHESSPQKGSSWADVKKRLQK